LTTNRPYQQAHTPEEALRIIQNLAGKRLDPVPVEALMAVYQRGEIRIQRFVIKKPIAAAAVNRLFPQSQHLRYPTPQALRPRRFLPHR